MTKEHLIESVSAHYDELNALNKIDNFYDYESDFVKLWAKMVGEVLEKILVYFLVTGEKKL